MINVPTSIIVKSSFPPFAKEKNEEKKRRKKKYSQTIYFLKTCPLQKIEK